MLNKDIILDFLKSHFSELQSQYHVSDIGLVGSFARDEQTEDSDIDLIIEFEPGTDKIYDLKLSLKQYLQDNFDRDIDICRKKYLKPYIKEYLEKEAIYV